MMSEIAILGLALLALYKSSEEVINSSVKLAKFFKISEMAIGFLLIAVATSLPELSVSVMASSSGQTGIAVGNVFGANIADIAWVLGISAILAGYLKPSAKEMKNLIGILFLTSLFSLVMLTNFFSRFYGIGLLLAFAAYVYFVLKQKISIHENGEGVSGREAVINAFIFCASIAVVIFSSRFVVDYAVLLAQSLNVSKTFIGATVVSIGTTLPELAVNITAIRKKKVGIAFGNILGSCITNMTLVLGAAAAISPISVNLMAFTNLVIFSLLVNIILWYILNQYGRITKKEGLVLVLLYIIFVISSIEVEVAI